MLAVNCYAQEKPVIIYPKAFNPQYDIVPIDTFDGWYFRAGNDTAWARNTISMAGWQKLSPIGLTAKYANKNGKVEGWFRIRIKLDSSVQSKGLSVNYDSYAPADIYVDGKLLGSFGNTGLFGHPYAEYDAPPFDKSLPLNLKRGQEFTLALHLTDSLAPFIPPKLKSRCIGTAYMIILGGNNSDRLIYSDVLNLNKSYSIWLWISLTLCTLFWILALQNRKESVLFLIAWCSTFFVCNIYTSSILAEPQTRSCFTYIIYGVLSMISILLVLVSIPIVLAAVFKRRMLLWIKICLAAIVVVSLSTYFLPQLAQPRPVSMGAIVLFPLGLSLYYIISSWKGVRGAQWSIIAGLLGSLSFMLTAIIILLLHIQIYTNYGIGYFLTSGLLLSFPLSMLVYVALRFKEIIQEVRYNANQVVQLSEEKKQEALNRQKLLEEEVNRQTAEIRANQARLIQSEKMASLGELTAGIAHEIQNPLNFVNNFSEVNTEMIEELEEELNAGNIEEALAIAADIKQNEQKINHHGKRADGIVKGMLQHSRTAGGEKQPTNINALADEFMRLSYHGLRAKDKSFNAEMHTHFDADLPEIEAVGQDIGRVLLNLFNNAFYAVNLKKKTAVAGYNPEVSVSTSSENGQVVIKVKDNGVGIPDAIKEKIMQPFFTTKPTGEGTGLGLSLSYDIVVKGHGGNIAVNSTAGEGSEFIVYLPLI